jgi:hypothetical protein
MATIAATTACRHTAQRDVHRIVQRRLRRGQQRIASRIAAERARPLPLSLASNISQRATYGTIIDQQALPRPVVPWLTFWLATAASEF